MNYFNLGKCSVCGAEMENEKLICHKDIHPSQVLSWLYLGSYFNATNKAELRKLNIKYIINCASECKNIFDYSNFTYLKLPLKDKKDFPIENYFDKANSFLKQVESINSNNNADDDDKGNVLVHCQLGKSRSASIVISYLIKEMNMSFNESYKFLKEKRKNISPNNGFIMKLKNLEKDFLPSISEYK